MLGGYGVVFLVLGSTLGLVLVLAFAAAALLTLVSFSLWMVERRLRGVEPEDPSQTHLEALGATFGQEVISAGALFALHPLGLIDPPLPADRILHGGRPILLVHGYMQARTSFLILGSRLAGFGLGPLYTINLRTLEGGLDHHAHLLSERIDQILRATEAKKVDIVAHSMGGLVARLAEGGRREPRVRRLVTLGTPHYGTQVGHVIPGAAARDMRPGSDLLRRLPNPPPGQLVSISSTHDFFVVPPESARVGPMGRDVVIRHVGHIALLTDSEVGIEVVKALGEDIQIRRSQDLFEAVEAAEPHLVAQPLVSSSLRRLPRGPDREP